MRNTLKFLLSTMYCAVMFGTCGYSMNNYLNHNNKHLMNQQNYMQTGYYKLTEKYKSFSTIIQPISVQFLGKNQNHEIYNAFKNKVPENFDLNQIFNQLKNDTLKFIISEYNNNYIDLFCLAWGILLKYAEDKGIDTLKKDIQNFINNNCIEYGIACDDININVYNQNNNNTNQINFHNINNINNNIANDYNIQTTKDEKYIKDYLTKQDTIRSGLNNVGATCYMNATLQCLANNPNLSAKIIKYKRNEQLNGNNKILSKQYAEVLENILFNKENKPYSPDNFKNTISGMNPLFAGVQANDSKDFVQFMLETLHRELNKAQPVDNVNNIIDQTNDVAMRKQFTQEFFNNNKSVISDQYYGVSRTISKCTGCNIEKYNYQIYTLLYFPLKETHRFKYPYDVNMNNNIINLYDCFDYNQKSEYFTGDNQMYCNHCKKLCDATYQTQIASLPNELVIVLNRGKANQDYNKPIIINDNINLSNYVTLPGQNCQYYLSGIVCHIGPSSMAGHFIAYTRNSQNGYWVKYNDSMATPEKDLRDGYQVKNDIQNILDGTTGYTPYILFYTKVNQ